jgi:methionyl-tRNA formyltransferase
MVWCAPRQNIPENANFLQMQEDLAERGGKILVQVLRDMLSGKVSSSYLHFIPLYY